LLILRLLLVFFVDADFAFAGVFFLAAVALFFATGFFVALLDAAVFFFAGFFVDAAFFAPVVLRLFVAPFEVFADLEPALTFPFFAVAFPFFAVAIQSLSFQSNISGHNSTWCAL
jgi:hypothetical protein